MKSISVNNVQALVPIRGYVRVNDTLESFAEFDRLISELPSFSGNSLLIKLLDDNREKDKLYLKDLTLSFTKTNKYVELFITKLKYDTVEFESDFIVLEFKFNKLLEHSYVSKVVNHYLERLVLLLNIAFATPISLAKGIVLHDGRYIGSTDHLINSLDGCYDHASRVNWPNLTGLGFKQFLTWIDKYDINLYERSSCCAGRAINAFSHLVFSKPASFESDHLFWSMLGLEAIYTKDNTNILGQIKEKSNLVLGSPVDYKNKLNKLYQFRSRLIHGDLDITPSYTTDYDNYGKEYSDYLDFSISILIQSIRKLIQNDINCFEFSLNWSNKKSI